MTRPTWLTLRAEPWHPSLQLESAFFEDADIGEVAVEAVVIEAVADDELVGDVEADVFGEDSGLFGDIEFVEQDACADRSGTLFHDRAAEEFEGASGVEDVINDDDMAAREVLGE